MLELARCSKIDARSNTIKFTFISDLPQEGPTIETPRKQYQVGETADLMCIAQLSNPPSNLSWYINGEPVSIKICI